MHGWVCRRAGGDAECGGGAVFGGAVRADAMSGRVSLGQPQMVLWGRRLWARWHALLMCAVAVGCAMLYLCCWTPRCVYCRGGPGRGTTADRPAYGGGAGPRRVRAGTTMGGGERGERGAYRAEAPFSEPRQRSGVATGACQGTSLEEAKEEAGDEGQSCPQ